jgi:hypothetical protein
MRSASAYIGGILNSVIVHAASQHEAIALRIVDAVTSLGVSEVVWRQYESVHQASVESHGQDVDTLVICLDDERGENAAELNLQLSKQNIPCLFVTVAGSNSRIGPWTYFGHTPCWECYRTTCRFFGVGAAPVGATLWSDAEMAALIKQSILEILEGTSALIGGSIHCPGGELRALKDPLCDICSIWSRQPTEAFYVSQD